MKIDILGGAWTLCKNCGDPFGTHFAVDMGIMEKPLCFHCIRIFLYDNQEECFEEFVIPKDAQE